MGRPAPRSERAILNSPIEAERGMLAIHTTTLQGVNTRHGGSDTQSAFRYKYLFLNGYLTMNAAWDRGIANWLANSETMAKQLFCKVTPYIYMRLRPTCDETLPDIQLYKLGEMDISLSRRVATPDGESGGWAFSPARRPALTPANVARAQETATRGKASKYVNCD
jgi:hypothetical protein